MYLTNTLILENSKLISNFQKEFPNVNFFNESNMPFSENILNSVNKSQVNKDNVNEIISFLDFLMVDKKIIRDFIIDHITKSLQGVNINKFHKTNLNFPNFISKGIKFIPSSEINMENIYNLPQKEIIIEDKLDWLKYLYEIFHDEIIFNIKFDSNHNNYDIHETCIDFFTIKHDSVNCLKYIREHFINNFNFNHVSTAIIFYSIKCLKFIFESGDNIFYSNEHYFSEEFDIPHSFYLKCAKYNRLECLEYLHEKNCKYIEYYKDNFIITSVTFQSYDCLKYFHEKMNCRITYKSIVKALKNNDDICLKYLLDNGNENDLIDNEPSSDSDGAESVYFIPVLNGYTKCMQLLLDYGFKLNDYRFLNLCEVATREDNIKSLEFLVKNGCDLGNSYEISLSMFGDCYFYLNNEDYLKDSDYETDETNE